MKYITAALTIFILATQAIAQDDWRERAVSTVMDYERIRKAQWADSGALWLFAYTDDTIAWDTVLSGIVCWKLNEAGKPSGEEVLVNIFAFEGSANGMTERLATGFCE